MLFSQHKSIEHNQCQQNKNVSQRPRSAVRTAVSYSLVAVLCVPVFLLLTWLTVNVGVLAFSDTQGLIFSLVLPVVACVLAICVVVFANPMHALLSLVGVFLFTVLFYVSSGIEFIGLVFLIVYVGAVAILFLFVIMLLNVKSLTTNEPLLNHATQTLALVFGGLLAYHLFITVADRIGRATLRARSHVDLQFTGIDDAVYYQVMYRSADVNAIAPLYTEHAPLFWIITINLLLALLGGIILATSTTEQTIKMVPETSEQTAAFASPPAICFKDNPWWRLHSGLSFGLRSRPAPYFLN